MVGFEIVEQKINKNPLLHRDELKIKIKFEKEVPSRKEIKDFISSRFSVDKKRIAIKKIKTKFGFHFSEIKVFIYEEPKWLALFEFLKKKDKAEEKNKKSGTEEGKNEESSGEVSKNEEKENGKGGENIKKDNAKENKQDEEVKKK